MKMNQLQATPIGDNISEVSERLGSRIRTVFSVTNDRGFIRSLDVFDKQVFSEDIANYKLVNQNDLAYNPSRINVGSVALLTEENGGAVSPMYCVVRCSPKLMPKYLLYFLKSNVGLAEITHRCEGAVRFQLKFKDLQQIPLLLPSINGQERIVDILEAAEEMRRLRVQANNHTTDLIPTLFDEMFGDPIRNTKGFPKYKLKQLGKVTTGTTPPSAMEGMFGGDIPFITPGDLEKDTSDPKRYVTISGANESRVVRAGSTLVCCIGATIGKADIAKKSSAFNQQINAIEWKESVDDFYGLFCMRRFSYIIARLGGAFALPILKKSLFEEIEIPLPPIAVQKEFSTRVEEIRSLLLDQSVAEQKLESLFQSLLHRAFEGEL